MYLISQVIGKEKSTYKIVYLGSLVLGRAFM